MATGIILEGEEIMDFEELKNKTLEWVKNNPDYKHRAYEELSKAKIAYENNINLVDEIEELNKKNDLSDGYILPVVLGLKELTELKPIELKQTKVGGGGGLDIDTDVSTAGKPLVKEYLKQKYGKERVISVGTYTTIGMSSAIRDILRYLGVSYKDTNDFCKGLDADLSFEENMSKYRQENPVKYNFYIKYKKYLDFVPKVSNMIRSCLPYYQNVDTLDGKKEISKLNPKVDKIAYVNSKGEKRFTNNYDVYKTGHKKVYEITLSDNTKIRATLDHKFFTNNGIKTLGEIDTKHDKFLKMD